MAKKIDIPSTQLVQITDNDVLDLVTKALYSDTSKEWFFEEDILQKTKLNYTKADVSRVWELLLASTMVEQSIGFGKAGKIELSTTGLNIMNKYGSYKEYLASQTSTAVANPPFAVKEIPSQKVVTKSTATKSPVSTPKK